MQESAFATRVQAQLAASRTLLASAPRVELTPAARALVELANAVEHCERMGWVNPKAQQGASCAPLLVVLALAIVLGLGVAHMASGAVDALSHALTLSGK